VANLKPALICALALLLPACGVKVAPWERGVLAKPQMALDPRPLETAVRQHVYNSREAASGGHGAGGGLWMQLTRPKPELQLNRASAPAR
jgi:hypothetical protein